MSYFQTLGLNLLFVPWILYSYLEMEALSGRSDQRKEEIKSSTLTFSAAATMSSNGTWCILPPYAVSSTIVGSKKTALLTQYQFVPTDSQVALWLYSFLLIL